jgi:signal transduction histidine kinase
MGRSLSLGDLIDPADQPSGERLMREMFEGKRDSFQLDSKSLAAKGQAMRWTAWRVSGVDGEQDYALALAQQVQEDPEAQRRLRQAQRLETVGRLASGVAHDFNNLLTGVLLYCDLLLAGLEPGHRARKYAEEIRSAGLQAIGLVRQLLAVSRPSNCEPRLLSLNEIAEGMRSLLVRLIGENIELKFRLDPSLGLIRMDHTGVRNGVPQREAVAAPGSAKCSLFIARGAALDVHIERA